MQVFLNDQFVPAEKAMLHISDLSIQRGYGVFDFFRVRDNVLLYVEDHIDRFLRSADLLHLTSPYSKDLLLVILHDLVEKNTIPDAGIKMILTGGYSPDGYEPTNGNFIIQQSPLVFEDSGVPKSVRIITHPFVRDLSEAKTINYSMGIWLQKKVKEQKADDVLYHLNDEVTEFPRCNFFMVTKDNVVITPQKNALRGVTRKKILEGNQTTYRVEEGTISLHDLQNAKEAFLTSSTKRIQAVVSVDGALIGDGKPGKITTDLLNMLLEIEKHYVAKGRIS